MEIVEGGGGASATMVDEMRKKQKIDKKLTIDVYLDFIHDRTLRLTVSQLRKVNRSFPFFPKSVCVCVWNFVRSIIPRFSALISDLILNLSVIRLFVAYDSFQCDLLFR